ncbi:DUF1819 family protein [Herbaspirillum seropedicae]|uniref:DUF1819 family protein n=1 Tax=Herbaspirillum seropedicae TaxID=964 RepID=UPI003FCD305A
MTERYRLSFTTGGLFLQESAIAAASFLQLGDWTATRAQLRGENLLQVRTSAAATRIGKEVTARLQELSSEELSALQDLSLRDQANLLWVAVCRHYPFIREFAIEVLREHFLVLRRRLVFADFEHFLNAKALWHAELDDIAKSTQLKLRQNLFRMLREADLLSDQHEIHPAQLSPYLAQLLARQGRQVFLVFPATDNDIQRWLQ